MKYVSVAALLVLTACAKSPDQIEAADIGPNPYTRSSCKQLAAEELQLTQNLANLSAAQKSAATGDTIGVILLGLPVSSMSGNDNEAGIAIAKGKIHAVQTAKIARNCS